jgi:hypothetical protein
MKILNSFYQPEPETVVISETPTTEANTNTTDIPDTPTTSSAAPASEKKKFRWADVDDLKLIFWNLLAQEWEFAEVYNISK